MSKKPYINSQNILMLDGKPIKVTRRAAIGIFDRNDNFLRIGSFRDYENYWVEPISHEDYEARKLEPEVPYQFWLYEPAKD